MIDACQSKWWIWNKVLQEVQVVVKEIQIYLERVKQGKRKTKFLRIIFISLRSCNVMSAFQLQLALVEANSWAHTNPQILQSHLQRSWKDLLKRAKKKPTTGHPPKNRVTEYSWKTSEISRATADSSTLGDKSQRVAKVCNGNDDLRFHLSVSGGRGKEGEIVNYKFRIKVKYAI